MNLIHEESRFIEQLPSSTELAYMAGIIDGEGSIYIGNFSSNKETGAKYYQTNIEVTNTDKSLIDWIFNKFGGSISTYTPSQTPKNSRRTVYKWKIGGSSVELWLPLLMPYLVIKQKQAETMLKMRNTYQKSYISKKGFQGIQPHTPELLELRQSYFQEMQSLHCRNYNNKKE